MRRCQWRQLNDTTLQLSTPIIRYTSTGFRGYPTKLGHLNAVNAVTAELHSNVEFQ